MICPGRLKVKNTSGVVAWYKYFAPGKQMFFICIVIACFLAGYQIYITNRACFK